MSAPGVSPGLLPFSSHFVPVWNLPKPRSHAIAMASLAICTATALQVDGGVVAKALTGRKLLPTGPLREANPGPADQDKNCQR